MPFEVLWSSVLKMPFPCWRTKWLSKKDCCWVRQKHLRKWTFFFLPWPPVKVERVLIMCLWGFLFRAIGKSVNTNGILSCFNVTGKKCFIFRCEVVIVIQGIYLITEIVHLSIPVAKNVTKPVWMNMEAKSEAAGSGHSGPRFLPQFASLCLDSTPTQKNIFTASSFWSSSIPLHSNILLLCQWNVQMASQALKL